MPTVDDTRLETGIIRKKFLTTPPAGTLAVIAVVDLQNRSKRSFQGNEPASLKGTVQDSGGGFNISDATLVFQITDAAGNLQSISATITTGSGTPIATVVSDINTAAGAVHSSLSGCAADDGSGYVEITSPYAAVDSQVVIGSNAGDDNADIGFALGASAVGAAERYAIMVFLGPEDEPFSNSYVYDSEKLLADAITTYNSKTAYGDL